MIRKIRDALSDPYTVAAFALSLFSHAIREVFADVKDAQNRQDALAADVLVLKLDYNNRYGKGGADHAQN